MWWAIVTLGTIGYGDVVPMTPLGKVIAAVTIFFGLVMIALPVGIIANAFSEQIHRRDFVVTWGMVAKVPLFSELEAGDIADIMQLLRAQTVEPGAVVVRRGDPAHSMYFIAGGEVEIELKERTVRLGVGHFFGEVAVLRRARRSATVTALTRSNLLVLDGHDLHALMDRAPRVAARMREMVRAKLGREVVSARGDIVTEEIDEGELEPEGADRPRSG
jgi:voltage-gated potassium channel